MGIVCRHLEQEIRAALASGSHEDIAQSLERRVEKLSSKMNKVFPSRPTTSSRLLTKPSVLLSKSGLLISALTTTFRDIGSSNSTDWQHDERKERTLVTCW